MTQLYAFNNGIFNPDGGSHVSGFQSALTRALKTTTAGLRGLKGVADISGADILPGLTAAIAITMPWEPKFEGQTKRKLLSPEIQGPVNSVVYQELQAFFSRSKNSKIARAIIQRALAAVSGRKAAAKARQLAGGRGVADAARSGILGKLVPVAGGRNKVAREQQELYLVEGDSAGGTAKLGRDPARQAILPLRGKPLNVEGRRLSKILDNQEFRTIIAAIGADVGRNFDAGQMEYGRVVILADADPDGGHITALLLTFFLRQMRPLIEAGGLAVAIPPLYKVENDQGARYCYSESERDETVASFGQATVKRFKGLGEMNDVELKEAIFDNPAGLRQVTIEDIHEAGQCVANLMGNNAAFRQTWLEERLKRS
jgi:DNA gyrase subunit B